MGCHGTYYYSTPVATRRPPCCVLNLWQIFVIHFLTLLSQVQSSTPKTKSTDGEDNEGGCVPIDNSTCLVFARAYVRPLSMPQSRAKSWMSTSFISTKKGKLLVLGGTGFLGQTICKRAVLEGIRGHQLVASRSCCRPELS
jgi:hypothetical protein